MEWKNVSDRMQIYEKMYNFGKKIENKVGT